MPRSEQCVSWVCPFAAPASRSIEIPPGRWIVEARARRPVSWLPRSASRRSVDDEDRSDPHGPGQIVEVGRGSHPRLVDRGELLLGAAALDADGVGEALVARRHGGIEPEEAAEVDLALRLDLQAFDG